jgi:hypothetical protein
VTGCLDAHYLGVRDGAAQVGDAGVAHDSTAAPP